jgi:L-iditol 2-dehydrogenase
MFEIPKTMRAVVYRGIDNLRVETVPVPEIGTGELLVKVAVCGICPTDIKKILHGTVAPPRIFGHETAGTIVRIGARVRGFKRGDRVALHHHVPCLKCHYCRHRAFAQCETYKKTGVTAGFEPAGGGFAEYVRVMPFCLPGVVKIPKKNSFVEGAMLEPVNTVLKAINRLNLLPRDHVLVVGQGPIGLMFTRLLRVRKMRVVATDLISPRLALAEKFGAIAALRADDPSLEKQCEAITRGLKFDAAIIAVPADSAVDQATRLIRGGGQVMLFAHTRRGCKSEVDLANVCVDEKDLIGSYSADFTLQEEAARLVFTRQLDVRRLVTDVFPLGKTAEGVAQASRPGMESLKIVVGETPVLENS